MTPKQSKSMPLPVMVGIAELAVTEEKSREEEERREDGKFAHLQKGEQLKHPLHCFTSRKHHLDHDDSPISTCGGQEPKSAKNVMLESLELLSECTFRPDPDELASSEYSPESNGFIYTFAEEAESAIPQE